MIACRRNPVSGIFHRRAKRAACSADRFPGTNTDRPGESDARRRAAAPPSPAPRAQSPAIGWPKERIRSAPKRGLRLRFRNRRTRGSSASGTRIYRCAAGDSHGKSGRGRSLLLPCPLPLGGTRSRFDLLRTGTGSIVNRRRRRGQIRLLPQCRGVFDVIEGAPLVGGGAVGPPAAGAF